MRPVDMSGIVNRTPDYAQIKQNEDQKPMTDQINFQAQFNKQVEKSQERVIKKRESDWKDEKFDAKEKGKNEFFNIRKKKDKKEEDDGTLTEKKKMSFDVKV